MYLFLNILQDFHLNNTLLNYIFLYFTLIINTIFSIDKLFDIYLILL